MKINFETITIMTNCDFTDEERRAFKVVTGCIEKLASTLIRETGEGIIAWDHFIDEANLYTVSEALKAVVEGRFTLAGNEGL